MKYLFLSLLLFLLIYPTEGSQNNLPGKLKRSGNIVELTVDGQLIRLEFCTPSTLRVRLADKSGFAPEEPYMVSRYTWDEVPFTLKEKRDELMITTSDLAVKVNTEKFAISIFTPDGKLINRDAGTDESAGKTGFPECTKELQPGEHFFGFGERMDFIDQLGKRLTLDVGRGTARDHETGAYNILEANYCPVPFFMSTRGYGIFLHNSTPSTWDMGNSNPGRYTFWAAFGEMDYYFIYGPSFHKIIQQYTGITGTSPLLPRAAMGLQVGTYSGGTWGFEQLTSQFYVVALARKFRELGIPVDILHLDSTWRIFGKINGKGGTSFEWRQPGFPDPKAMFDTLYDLHYKMVGLHIRP